MSDDEHKAVCPTCWDTVTTDLLCEHDDPDTGPLCTNRCCAFWHEGKAVA